jgi:hypothetical protein
VQIWQAVTEGPRKFTSGLYMEQGVSGWSDQPIFYEAKFKQCIRMLAHVLIEDSESTRYCCQLMLIELEKERKVVKLNI